MGPRPADPLRLDQPRRQRPCDRPSRRTLAPSRGGTGDPPRTPPAGSRDFSLTVGNCSVRGFKVKRWRSEPREKEAARGPGRGGGQGFLPPQAPDPSPAPTRSTSTCCPQTGRGLGTWAPTQPHQTGWPQGPGPPNFTLSRWAPPDMQAGWWWVRRELELIASWAHSRWRWDGSLRFCSRDRRTLWVAPHEGSSCRGEKPTNRANTSLTSTITFRLVSEPTLRSVPGWCC